MSMKIVRVDKYRSKGRGAHESDDMIRMEVHLPFKEMRALPDLLAGAIKVEMPAETLGYEGVHNEEADAIDRAVQGTNKTSAYLNAMRGGAPRFLLFSERQELERRYVRWLRAPEPEGAGGKALDCPATVFTFLAGEGLLGNAPKSDRIQLVERLRKAEKDNEAELISVAGSENYGRAAELSGVLAGLRLARRLAENMPGLFGGSDGRAKEKLAALVGAIQRYGEGITPEHIRSTGVFKEACAAVGGKE